MVPITIVFMGFINQFITRGHHIVGVIPSHHSYIPYAPWCWNIYLHVLAILGVNVGKYSIHGSSGYVKK